MSIGQEYMDRTLPLLLTVPVRRERLLLVKLGVLGAMLLTLGVVAYTYVFAPFFPAHRQAERLVTCLLPVLYGLCLAPWLTMVCRSPVAGAVVTAAIPFVLMTLAVSVEVPGRSGLGGHLRVARDVGHVRDGSRRDLANVQAAGSDRVFRGPARTALAAPVDPAP